MANIDSDLSDDESLNDEQLPESTDSSDLRIDPSPGYLEWLFSPDWPEWYRRIYWPVRCSFIGFLEPTQCNEHEMILSGGHPHFIEIHYYEEVAMQMIFRELDPYLSDAPATLWMLAGGDESKIEEVTADYAESYADNMRQCFAQAMSLFRDRYVELIGRMFMMASNEVAAQAIDKFASQRMAKPWDPITGKTWDAIESTIKFWSKKQQIRLGVKPGRKKGTGVFPSREAFETWLIFCIFECLHRGGRPRRQDVVDFFNEMNAKGISTIPKCESVDKLDDWMKYYEIKWSQLVDENKTIPEVFYQYRERFEKMLGYLISLRGGNIQQ